MAADIDRTTWNRLPPERRAALAAVVADRSNDAFHDQYRDAMGWWLLLILACVGGGAAAWWEVPGGGLGLLRGLATSPLATLEGCLRSPPRLGLLAAMVLGPWTAVTWVHNHNRRGLALTEDAMVVVRGRHLRILRYADVTGVQRTRHGRFGRRARPFTVLALTTTAGGRLRLFTTARWADAFEQRILRAAA